MILYFNLYTPLLLGTQVNSNFSKILKKIDALAYISFKKMNK